MKSTNESAPMREHQGTQNNTPHTAPEILSHFQSAVLPDLTVTPGARGITPNKIRLRAHLDALIGKNLTWAEHQNSWVFVYSEHGAWDCPCGKQHITDLCVISYKHASITTVVGNCCVQDLCVYGSGVAGAIIRQHKTLKKVQSRLAPVWTFLTKHSDLVTSTGATITSPLILLRSACHQVRRQSGVKTSHAKFLLGLTGGVSNIPRVSNEHTS